MGVIAHFNEEQAREELRSARRSLERLRARSAPWLSVDLAEKRMMRAHLRLTALVAMASHAEQMPAGRSSSPRSAHHFHHAAVV